MQQFQAQMTDGTTATFEAVQQYETKTNIPVTIVKPLDREFASDEYKPATLAILGVGIVLGTTDNGFALGEDFTHEFADVQSFADGLVGIEGVPNVQAEHDAWISEFENSVATAE